MKEFHSESLMAQESTTVELCKDTKAVEVTSIA